jgi:hypothetical protein
MMRLILLALGLVLLTADAPAATRVDVSCLISVNEHFSGEVFLDKKPVGRTPLSLRVDDPGHHEILIRNEKDRLEQTYSFDDLVGEFVHRRVRADFTTGAMEREVLRHVDTIAP